MWCWRCCSVHHLWRRRVAAAVLLLSALGTAGGSRDTLRRPPGESVRVGQTLLASAGGVFELGTLDQSPRFEQYLLRRDVAPEHHRPHRTGVGAQPRQTHLRLLRRRARRRRLRQRRDSRRAQQRRRPGAGRAAGFRLAGEIPKPPQGTYSSLDVPSEKPAKVPTKMPVKIALPIISVIVLICGPPFCCFIWGICKEGEANSEEQLLLSDIGSNGVATYAFVDVNKMGSERGPEICVYSFSNMLAATDSFSDDKKLGQGGFGPVYKGRLPDGQEIAIKRLSTRSAQGLQEFKTEILIIARLQHKNLVRLLGCCVQREERLLIYEYMPNKSLDYFLFDPERSAQLDWDKRLQIIEGIAQGLLYLHKYSRVTIIHRDLKASNILLDNDMNPKISDFGMARIFSSNEGNANTQRIVGTYGYMSPEYAMEGRFSVKSDVFSFGVLILEIVSDRKNIGSHHHFPVHGSLLNYAWDLWNTGEALALVDSSLGGSWCRREVSRCIHVGLACVQECAEDRPTMAEAVAMLAGDQNVGREVPKQPAFFWKRDTAPAGSTGPAAAGSANGMSMSAMEGR